MAIPPLQLPSSQAVSGGFDFSPLANLGNTYREAQNRQKLSDLGKGIANGTLDYRQAAAQAADMGSPDAVFKFLTLDEAKRKQADELAAAQRFNTTLTGIFGGGAAPQGQPLVPSSASPTSSSNVPMAGPPQPAGARPPVQSSSTTWGDREAEDAGLYEPSAPRAGGVAPASPPPMSLASLGTSVPPPSSAAPGRVDRVAPSITSDATSAPPTAPARAAPTAGPAPANGFQGLNATHIPVLLGAISDPRTPTAQKELASKLIGHALDASKPNEKIQQLRQLKEASGYQGTILELEKELRAAGKTDVTVDQRGETEEAKSAGKAAGERRATMFASAGSASKTLQNLSRMEGLLNQVEQGKLAPTRMSVSSWAKALGLNDEVATSLGLDPKGVGSAQALQSLVNEAVISKIGPGGFPANNFSDADREFITGIYPRLGDDPQANKIRIEGARRMANLDLQRARDYQAWKKDPANARRSFEDFEVEWSDKIAKQDIFGDLRKEAEALVTQPRGSAAASPQTPQGRSSTAPVQGAQQAPDGNWYVPDPQRPGKYMQVR